MACALTVAGCGDDGSDAPLAAGGGHSGAAESPLRAFCHAGAAACAEVTEDGCVDIVLEAGKVVHSSDLPCINAAEDCGDTEVCLDALADLPPTADGGEPTSQPAS